MGDFGQKSCIRTSQILRGTIDAGVRLFDDRSRIRHHHSNYWKNRKASPEGLDYDTGAIPMVEQEKIPHCDQRVR